MRTRRAFTLVEAGFSAAAVMVALAVGAVGVSQPEDATKKPAERPAEKQPEEKKKKAGDGGTLGALRAARASARQIKDSTQVRGIHQGLVMFAQNNQDRFPLPSLLDKKNTTLEMPAAEKDTTEHIMSILIYNGFFGPELCYAPGETNKNIKVMGDYLWSEPAAAAKPKEALWDPAFNADFTGKKPGNFSYAHSMPSPTRLKYWSNSFVAAEPVVANRGPRIEALMLDGQTIKPRLPEKSNTYGIHGPEETWEGNVVFNDNAVFFKTEMTGDLKYEAKDKTKLVDNFFFNEQDDPTDSNAVLGIYVNSGPGTKFFRGIWD